MQADAVSQKLAEAIETRSRDLGFDRIGFAPALPPARAGHFRRWLDEGKAGTMTYLHRSAERRLDPRRVLDGAKTIISVAQSYFSGRLPDDVRRDPSRGQIASYAWGQDYHDVLLARLGELAAWIGTQVPGHAQKSYVDTGHILERDHGERAGIGFIGKNTLLISPRFGSTFFLGEIITTLDLPASPAVRQPSCGSCTRCLDVCPTHALPAAHVLDSPRCISYLTIEYRGLIPRELRARMGNHVFGCDDCQTCCPWNQRFSKETAESAYRATLERQAPRLADLAMLTDEAFRTKFAGSGVLRPRHSGMMRNVAVALGNWGAEEALDPLEHLARSADPLVRAHAIWGISRNVSYRADGLLREQASAETDERVLAEIRQGEVERERRTPGAPS